MNIFLLIVRQLKVSCPLYDWPRSLREDKVYPSGVSPNYRDVKHKPVL